MSFWKNVKAMFANNQSEGSAPATCPHCGTRNSVENLGTPAIPGVTVTEVIDVNCRNCGRQFIVMNKK